LKINKVFSALQYTRRGVNTEREVIDLAAPHKVTLDYFPHEVTLSVDSKFNALKRKFGFYVPYIYERILEIAYGRDGEGYYIKYSTEREKENCIEAVLQACVGKYTPEPAVIAEIIEGLTAYGLFDDRHPGIITSKRMQKNYYAATVDRKGVTIDNEIWELTFDEMKKLSQRHSYYIFLNGESNSDDNQPNNSINRPNNSINRPNNEQIKSDQIKLNKNNNYNQSISLIPNDDDGEDGQTDGQNENSSRERGNAKPSGEEAFFLDCVQSRINDILGTDDPFTSFASIRRFERIIQTLPEKIKIGSDYVSRSAYCQRVFDILRTAPSEVEAKLSETFYKIDGNVGIKNKSAYTLAALYNLSDGT
jgi:hypothetical protein